MGNSTILPPGENLRRAIQWLSERQEFSPEAIEKASKQFDLSPLEEAFLLKHFKLLADNNNASQSNK